MSSKEFNHLKNLKNVYNVDRLVCNAYLMFNDENMSYDGCFEFCTVDGEVLETEEYPYPAPIMGIDHVKKVMKACLFNGYGFSWQIVGDKHALSILRHHTNNQRAIHEPGLLEKTVGDYHVVDAISFDGMFYYYVIMPFETKESAEKYVESKKA